MPTDRRCEVNLPALHTAANRASELAQKRYLQLVKANLTTLVVGSIAGGITLSAGLPGRLVAAIAAIALAVALILTFIIENKGYERTWYGGRAVAESVKTLAWRYMTRAEPFVSGDLAKIDELFAQRLHQLLSQGSTLNVALLSASGDQITEQMRQMRGKSLTERRDFYAECRIHDQRTWYGDKASQSASAAHKLFRRMWIMNILAICAALIIIIIPTVLFNVTGSLATTAASIFGWLQVRRHQELAQAYAVTEQELGLIQSKTMHISSEEEFAVFVADAEAAVSREHTLWVARRDAGLSPLTTN